MAGTLMTDPLKDKSTYEDNEATNVESQAAFNREAMAQRVRKLALKKNLTAADLGRALEIKKSAASNYWNGFRDWPTDRLVPLADLLDVNPRWLLSGDGDAVAGDAAAPDGSVMVQEIDLAYGMGSTYLDVAGVEPKAIPFPSAWLRTFTSADAEHLFFARGDGDSMMPTILDQDIVLIDRSQIAINRQDRIWALAYGELGMIKRVRAMPDGSYQLLSDNPNVEPATAVDGEMSVIGRVVAVIRRT
ncbi:XRE family transcriptional regulator [Blastomonas fulva]|uniref:XRE family transcriptional regulator n=1 Tax=Blastomonas fulva TaxID=1550728 RepID=UPI0025A44A94|nr:LexA family transcriptional regulator [Blastomonas fulva]MDM7928701.1 LexA family transcriptional regulator [Blastomonas fulva]MDM7964487.1 LexA family transcriptional regulator [Blastomonas fulva]